ncbi:hypothetical protein [Streptomyces sp. YIM 98790]|uniref:hypothetical protein n=1 Tax=Streptomyces sp. YIM 98790 TaxID=2689077 RepID=UPI00140C5B35|nr:hypothetical protein [Streptomyces sp. YIM 98790]
MIIGLIAAAEAGFWVVLAAGLAVRYLLRSERASRVLLYSLPLIDILLLAATAIDLRRGAEPSGEHGLAALYLGFTVAYGHTVIAWADARFAHRFAGGPPPPRPPEYGAARARYEGRLWLLTLGAVAMSLLVLEGLIRFAAEPAGGGAEVLRGWQVRALTVLAVHGVIALSYALFPKRAPSAGKVP